MNKSTMQEIKSIFIILSYISLSKCDIEPFVVDGQKASIKQFPHSAFLNVRCTTVHSAHYTPWICGASIINDHIVLTAAHCLYSCNSKSKISISVGHIHRAKGISSSLSNYLVHDKYKDGEGGFDIALATLTTPLKFSKNVKRVALMPDPPYTEKAQIAGWGALKEDPFLQGNHLMYIDQWVWAWKSCKLLIKSLPKGSFCAASGDGYSYASRGDSGSALVVRGYIQIGLVSYKVPKVSRSLVVYTDTGYFYNWIKKNSKRLYCV